MLLRRLLRLRCPNCGGSAVLRSPTRLHSHCSSCGFRFERSDENYFSGAVFVNYMFCGAMFVVAFLLTMLITWPDVPWTLLTYGMPAVMVAAVILLHPVSKVMWLTLDVLVRPVMPDEIVGAEQPDRG
jgi:uncharacterized protein (DUF983 family)